MGADREPRSWLLLASPLKILTQLSHSSLTLWNTSDEVNIFLFLVETYYCNTISGLVVLGFSLTRGVLFPSVMSCCETTGHGHPG